MAGRPVFLTVDDELLTEIARVHGWPLEDPSEDLAAAVRNLSHHQGPFSSFTRRGLKWWRLGAQSQPPFVGALALMVLAASRMGMTGPRRASSFYRELRRLLRMPESTAMPDGFDVDVAFMWERLGQWLDGPQNGQLGSPTAWAPPHLRHVGWALSQCLVRAGDRQRLFDFFRSVGAAPGEDLPGEQLLAYLQLWSRTHGGFRPTLSAALGDGELAPLLADVLHRELRRWDGTDRDPSGRVALTAELTVWLGRPGYLAAVVRLPAGTEALSVAGEQYAATAGGGLAFLPDVLTDQLIDGGSFPARLRGDVELTIRMPHRDLIVLPVDDALGCFRSADTARLSVEHCILVREPLAVEAATAAAGLSDQPVVLARRLTLPAGWVAYTGYRPRSVQVNPALRPSGALAVLAPSVGQLAQLEGGLPLTPHGRVYLADGAPDVVVPADNPGQLPVAVDGRTIAIAPSSGLVLRLSKQLHDEGEHEVAVGGKRWQLRLITRRLDPPPPAAEQDLGSAEEDVQLVPLSGRHVLLGAAGQVAEVFPTPPGWLRHAQLHASRYDPASGLPELPFAGCWLLRRPGRGPVEAYQLACHRTTTPGARPPHVPSNPRAAAAWPWLAEVVVVRPEQRRAWAAYRHALEGAAISDELA